MKRVGNLYYQVYAIENLYLAWYKTQKGKSHKPDVILFRIQFEDRVLHHAIMNILDPHFEKFQIHDSYACRTERGVHLPVKRAFYFTKKYRYFVKMDVNFFSTL